MTFRLQALTASRRAFYRSLPWQSALVLLSAIFLTFGSVGFIEDMWGVREMTPWTMVAVNVAYTGLVAIGYVIAFTQNRKLLALVVPFHLLVPNYVMPKLQAWFGPVAPPVGFDVPAVSHRLQADGIGAIVMISLGYGLFISFISRTGVRQLRLRTEVALAERLHASLVPPVDRATPRLEIFGRSEPSSEVGGDLLDVIERDDGLVACVADVSGHGVSAGAFMGMVKSALRMRLLRPDRLDAALDDVNEVVAQVRSPEMFVTFAGIRFDATNVAELALAGHLPILHYRRALGTITPVDNQLPPLGLVTPQRHVSARVPFEPGDLFALLTDGLTEVADRRGQQFGAHAIENIILQNATRPLSEIYAAVLAAVREHGHQTDDQTLLLVRVKP